MVKYEYGTIISLLSIAGIPHKKVGSRYMGVCPACRGGYKTPCCSYSPEKNVWKCFSCGEKGGVKKLMDLVNLNVNLNNFSTTSTSFEKKEEKNGQVDVTESIKPFVSRKADKESLKWLESRGLEYENVKRFIRFISPKKKWHYENGFRVAIPAFDKEGRTRNVKIRNIFPDSKRKNLGIEMKVLSWKGGENYTMGMNFLPEDANFVLIVEGEMDYLSVKSINPDFPVVALPSANYRFKDEVKHLPKKVYIALDNDEAGRYHTERLIHELIDSGKKVIPLAYPERVKDFNDLLMESRKEAEKWLSEIEKKKKRFFGLF